VCSERLSVLIILQWSVPILYLWLFLKGIFKIQDITVLNYTYIAVVWLLWSSYVLLNSFKNIFCTRLTLSKWIHLSFRNEPSQKWCVLIYFLGYPLIYWLSKFLYTQFYLTLFEYWCIDDILKIAIHQFYVNTNERTIQLWRATIADSLARYYLMRYHFQIKLNTNEDGDVTEAAL